MSAKRKEILSNLVGSSDDFEFYPTTSSLIKVINQDMAKTFTTYFSKGKIRIGSELPSVLDIGAGDGEALLQLNARKRYAIEKSVPLLDAMPQNISVIGTVFEEQTLIDKQVDCIFCNPPYSNYVSWVDKIIREANAPLIYLVVPSRWEDNQSIADAIDARKAKCSVIDSSDFLKADRAARCKVDVVRVDLSASRSKSAFDLWFESTIEISRNADTLSHVFANKKHLEEKVGHELVAGRDLVSVLSQMYDRDLQGLIKIYQQLENIPGPLLDELNVNAKDVLSGLEIKIKGLKNTYWGLLFDNLTKITDRLCFSTRRDLLDSLMRSTSVDFSAGNAYPIVRWAIVEANRFISSQLIDLVETMTKKASCIAYKSNQNTWGDGDWRYNQKPHNLNRYFLDYRFILDEVGGIEHGTYAERSAGLKDRAFNIINDLRTVASNLGFSRVGEENVRSAFWESGKKREFYCKNVRTGKEHLLFDVRVFDNQNMHLRLNTDFMLALNVEFGRLKGWLKNKEDAISELDAEAEAVMDIWGVNSTVELPPPGVLKLDAPPLAV
ncbi:DUF4942 domain-containing protein [Porticoccaceae bacterium]|nr:DUF4942 domain-containing protein [Porticoccaceae bacterium]